MDQQNSPQALQFQRLLNDVSGVPAAESKRAKYMAVAQMLSRREGRPVSFRTVEKWFERQSIPGIWLLKLAAAAANENRPVDLAKYA